MDGHWRACRGFVYNGVGSSKRNSGGLCPRLPAPEHDSLDPAWGAGPEARPGRLASVCPGGPGQLAVHPAVSGIRSTA